MVKAPTWRCHICGDERPEGLVAVRVKSTLLGGHLASEHIRFCIDRLSCVEGSKTFTFFSGKD